MPRTPARGRAAPEEASPPNHLREDFAALKQLVHEMKNQQQVRLAADINAARGPAKTADVPLWMKVGGAGAGLLLTLLTLGGIGWAMLNAFSAARVQDSAMQARVVTMEAKLVEMASTLGPLRDKVASMEQGRDTGRRILEQQQQSVNDQLTALRQSDISATAKVDALAPLLAELRAQLVEIRRWQETIDRRLDRSGYMPPTQRGGSEAPAVWTPRDYAPPT